MSRIQVSIIIVAFQAQKKLSECLKSIPKNKTYETIVIDNSINNRGFGAACNAGAKKAKGSYLFFLNPDTKLQKTTISTLVKAVQNNPEIGCISPQFLDDEGKAYGSYSKQPTLLTAPLRFSFLYSLLPTVLKKMVHPYDFDTLNQLKYVDAVSGAAILIPAALFHTIGGFDEQFFMYWEDYDLCQRVNDAGKKILYLPTAKIIHSRGGTTQNQALAHQYFIHSRYLFFKKKFDPIAAAFLEFFLRFCETLS